jgi:pimeloyl-ACP methyl ester carboxylesterase
MAFECELAECEAADGVVLQGLWKKGGPRAKKAVILVHGLGSAFYWEKMLEAMGKCFGREFGIACFRNRGTGLITRLKKVDKRKKNGFKSVTCGSAFEEFTDCVKDIDGVIGFCEGKGARELFLVGHSTGANKVAYYCSRKPSKRVKGIALLSPASDLLAFKKVLKERFPEARRKAQAAVETGAGNKLMPPELVQDFVSANRFLSLATEFSEEDVFSYHSPEKRFRALSKVRVPVFVAFGEFDEFVDRKPGEITRVIAEKLERSPRVKTVLAKSAGHSLAGREKRVAGEMAKFFAGKI